MNNARWEELNRLFDKAIALPLEDREAFLDRECNDEELKKQVESLIHTYQDADDILYSLDQFASPQPVQQYHSGDRIGHYRIVREIGQGGMGQVFLAEDTRLLRSVALKFLPPYINPLLRAEERFLNEARTASALDHPNLCTIHEINAHEGKTFIAMAYYEGETLKEKIQRGPLSITDSLRYITQLADGLKSAHAKGIIHRDIKPANVLITPDDRVILLDFGLAKIAKESQQYSTEGMMVGTLAYMSPEQTRGHNVDTATDLWSLGIVLYEMVSGKQPFQGDSNSILIEAIRNDQPTPLADLSTDIRPELDGLVKNLLDKDPNGRATAASLLQQITHIERPSPHKSVHSRTLARKVLVGALLAAMVVLLAAWPLIRNNQEAEALLLIPDIQSLAQSGNFTEAFELAKHVEQHLKDDSALTTLWPSIADYITIETEPTGARVTAQQYVAQDGERPAPQWDLGKTPISNVQLPRGAYKLLIQKEGFAPVERMISRHLFEPTIVVEQQLIEEDRIPEDMVFVPGGPYMLRGQDLLSTETILLADYAIDRYEVSNREFKAFIEAGGYRDSSYWHHSFVKNGDSISWKDGVSTFTDRTGLHGPRNWTNQNPPSGEEDFPVTNITWYEAAAYSAWKGKRLPSIFEWQHAARQDTIHPRGIIMPWGSIIPNESVEHRANFSSTQAVPVDHHPFGVSPYGAYNMAGNAREWASNPMGDGYVTAGGSWADPEYAFAYLGSFPGFFSSSEIGFRSAQTIGDSVSAHNSMPLPGKPPIPEYTPVNEETYLSFLSHYRYDPLPLGAHINATEETADWIRETITFSGAKGEQLIAYLYLPKHAAPPYQTILFSPPFPVLAGWYSIRQEAERTLAPLIKTGRAVLAIVPKGGLERPREGGFTFVPVGSVQMREMGVEWALEYSRGVDYLKTRNEIDLERIAHIGFSAGGSGLIFPALEEIYSSILLISSGLPLGITQKLPESNSVNFVPQYKAPVLMINGRFDEIYSIDTNVRPLFDLLPHPKRLEIVNSGHVPPLEMSIPLMRDWFDETLGPVIMK